METTGRLLLFDEIMFKYISLNIKKLEMLIYCQIIPFLIPCDAKQVSRSITVATVCEPLPILHCHASCRSSMPAFLWYT